MTHDAKAMKSGPREKCSVCSQPLCPVCQEHTERRCDQMGSLFVCPMHGPVERIYS